MRNTILCFGALLMSAQMPATAAYIYAPGAQYETQEGAGQGVIFSKDSVSHLQIGFDSSLFGSAPVSIQDISFRFDSLTNQTQVPTVLYDFGQTTIKLATVADVNALSGTFAANLGSDVQTVLDRGYTLTSSNTGPAAGPRSWGFVFTFDQAFVYDPTKGDLIVDLQTGRNAVTYATLDMVFAGNTERLLFASNNGPTGNGNAAFDGGPVSRLRVGEPMAATVPEITTWAMMLIGFGMIGNGLRRRRVVPLEAGLRHPRLS